MRTPLHVLWQLLRYAQDVTGESDYERYLEHHQTAGHPGEPLSRKVWFRRSMEDRYAAGSINRCC